MRTVFYSVSTTPPLTGLSSAFQTSTHRPALSCNHPTLLLPHCCAHSSVGILLLLPSFSPFRFVCAFIIYLIGNDSHRRHTVSLARASACRSCPGDGSVRSGWGGVAFFGRCGRRCGGVVVSLLILNKWSFPRATGARKHEPALGPCYRGDDADDGLQ